MGSQEWGCARVNLPLKTWGGKQFWSDHTIYAGWRIQQHIYTRHIRLLDARDIRKAWGDLAVCEHALALAKARGEAALSSDRLCVLLHGLGRSKDSMAHLQRALTAAGFQAYSVNYASTRRGIPEVAEHVAALLRRAALDFREISMVTHSLGGIVARSVMTLPDAPPVARLVMIAPPNQGAEIANRVARRLLARLILGPAASEVRTDRTYLGGLPPPPCPFGIITGGRGGGPGWNPFLAGDNDGVLSVESTQLDGAKEVVVVHRTHTFIMNAPEVIAMTVHFLQTGTFGSEKYLTKT